LRDWHIGPTPNSSAGLHVEYYGDTDKHADAYGHTDQDVDAHSYAAGHRCELLQ
jgi:hypothetical protein